MAYKFASAEAGAYWDRHFPNTNEVDYKFMAQEIGKSFAKQFPNESFILPLIQYGMDVLDENGQVSKQEFDFFAVRFGPFDRCVSRCCDSAFNRESGLIHRWYHAHPNRKEDDKNFKLGAFLIRPSAQHAGKFTLSYMKKKDEKFVIKSIYVNNVNGKFAIEGENNQHASLTALVVANNSYLTIPLPSYAYSQMSKQTGHTAQHDSGNSYSLMDPAENHNSGYSEMNPSENKSSYAEMTDSNTHHSSYEEMQTDSKPHGDNYESFTEIGQGNKNASSNADGSYGVFQP